ncbi:hypothetical protein JKP88DRAFT_318985 [Tribonema minus]|uniref:Nudix hydrolase domain-containing protein n=1 Tax=Tribonema minus TaxID=303371 RepID=A0A835YXA0_9STRA|nr:hypothetical protein JKP88DRAFT_318985 [Tribonema minus]
MLRALIGGVGRGNTGLLPPDPDEFLTWAGPDPLDAAATDTADTSPDGVDDDDAPPSTETDNGASAADADGGDNVGGGARASVAALLRVRRAQPGSAGHSFANVRELLAALDDGDAWVTELLVIRRADNAADAWSGHIALPGGRRARGEDGLACAVREVHEEVGLRVSARTHLLLGKLRDRRAGGDDENPLAVTCYVFVTTDSKTARARPRCAPSEVAHAWWVDVVQLWPVPRVEQAPFPVSAFPRHARRCAWRALRAALRIDTVWLPCFRLPPPPDAPKPAAADRDAAARALSMWGFTFWLVNDLLSAAGGETCDWLAPHVSTHVALADLALVWLHCAARWLEALAAQLRGQAPRARLKGE